MLLRWSIAQTNSCDSYFLSNVEGESSFLVNGAMFGRDYPTRQYSFTMLQRVRGAGGGG